MAEVADAKKIILIKYFKEPKHHDVTYIRENSVLDGIARKLMEKFNLDSKQKAYELALLSTGLKIEPEMLAPLLAKRTKSNSKKVLLEAYELLLEAEF